MTAHFDIVAQRTLTAGDTKLLVLIAKPVQDEDDYRCAYSLVGDGGIQKDGYVLGMDSVQALQLVMKRIDSDVSVIGQQIGLSFSWLDDELGVSGFGELVPQYRTPRSTGSSGVLQFPCIVVG